MAVTAGDGVVCAVTATQKLLQILVCGDVDIAKNILPARAVRVDVSGNFKKFASRREWRTNM